MTRDTEAVVRGALQDEPLCAEAEVEALREVGKVFPESGSYPAHAEDVLIDAVLLGVLRGDASLQKLSDHIRTVCDWMRISAVSSWARYQTPKREPDKKRRTQADDFLRLRCLEKMSRMAEEILNDVRSDWPSLDEKSRFIRGLMFRFPKRQTDGQTTVYRIEDLEVLPGDRIQDAFRELYIGKNRNLTIEEQDDVFSRRFGYLFDRDAGEMTPRNAHGGWISRAMASIRHADSVGETRSVEYFDDARIRGARDWFGKGLRRLIGPEEQAEVQKLSLHRGFPRLEHVPWILRHRWLLFGAPLELWCRLHMTPLQYLLDVSYHVPSHVRSLCDEEAPVAVVTAFPLTSDAALTYKRGELSTYDLHSPGSRFVGAVRGQASREASTVFIMNFLNLLERTPARGFGLVAGAHLVADAGAEWLQPGKRPPHVPAFMATGFHSSGGHVLRDADFMRVKDVDKPIYEKYEEIPHRKVGA